MHEITFYQQLLGASPHPYLILRVDADGGVSYIIHHLEDETELIAIQERTSCDGEAKLKLSKVKARAERLQAEILRRAAEVKEANRALESALGELSCLNRRLTEQDHLNRSSLLM